MERRPISAYQPNGIRLSIRDVFIFYRQVMERRTISAIQQAYIDSILCIPVCANPYVFECCAVSISARQQAYVNSSIYDAVCAHCHIMERRPISAYQPNGIRLSIRDVFIFYRQVMER